MNFNKLLETVSDEELEKIEVPTKQEFEQAFQKIQVILGKVKYPSFLPTGLRYR